MYVLKALIYFVVLALALPAVAQDKVLNIYSARHYQTDEALYAGFTQRTGIKINRIEAGEDALIERIRSEGARSPADVLITVDAGRRPRFPPPAAITQAVSSTQATPCQTSRQVNHEQPGRGGRLSGRCTCGCAAHG